MGLSVVNSRKFATFQQIVAGFDVVYETSRKPVKFLEPTTFFPPADNMFIQNGAQNKECDRTSTAICETPGQLQKQNHDMFIRLMTFDP